MRWGIAAAVPLLVAAAAGPVAKASESNLEQHAKQLAGELDRAKRTGAVVRFKPRDRDALRLLARPAKVELESYEFGVGRRRATCDYESNEVDREVCSTGYPEPDPGVEPTTALSLGASPLDLRRRNTCYLAKREYGVTVKNGLGMRLFSYKAQPRWCHNGTNVYSFSPNLIPRVHAVFIEHSATNIGPGFITRPPTGMLLYLAVGRFKSCFSVFGCVKTYTPEIKFNASRYGLVVIPAAD